MAFNEFPPKSKKLSLIPILSTFNISLQIFAIILSISLLGAIYSTFVLNNSSGSGRFFLLILPFIVNGSLSIFTKNGGIIYSGSCVAK